MGRPFAPHVITDDSALGSSVIEKSLRFYSNTNLTRTSSSASTTFTYSVWIKRCKFSGYQYFFSMAGKGFAFHTSNNTIYLYDGTSLNESTAKFRDPSAWYHIVVQINSGTATSYVNNVLTHNAVGGGAFTLSTSSNATKIGSYDSGYYFDGYMAEIHLVDGSVVAPTSFGFTDSQTGIWMPQKYTGSHGTNGFYLNFLDNSSTSALGKDTSGNGNDFTTNNFSVSAGTGNDSLEDTPTNNFCTLNAVNQDTNTTLSEGSLKAAGSSSTAYSFHTQGTFVKSSGKWYYEVEYTANGGGTNSDLPAIGWARTTLRPTDNPTGGGGLCYRPARGDYIDLAGNNPTSKPTTSLGNVVQVAIDFDAGKIWFGNGGTYFESGNPSTGANANITFTGGAELLSPFVRSLSSTFNFNFGQRPFSYTVPTGFKTLCSNNIFINTTPIIRPQKHFDTVLYTGNASDQKITGLEFKPDMIWFKSRTSTSTHGMADSVRGRSKLFYPDTNQAEQTSNTNRDLVSFDHDGFTLGNPQNLNSTNGSGLSIVAWCWKGGGASVTNNDGSGTSQVSANQEAGLSIVTYSGNATGGSNSAVWQTIGHGLGKTPKMIIFKSRNGGESHHNWATYHHLVTDANTDYVKLNTTEARVQTDVNYMGSTLPTSSVFSLGYNYTTNENGKNYVAYCFSEVAGYSKFGKYTGNGNADGTFVFLGFRPAFILIKRTDATEDWWLYDNKRDPDNPMTQILYGNANTAEISATGDDVSNDFVSNGVKLRTANANWNANGGTYIYMAFASQPGITPYQTDFNAR